MKTSPLLSGIYVGLVLLALDLAFALGSYSAGKRAAYDANADTLMFLNGIELALDRHDLDLARQRTDQAIDCHVGVLSELKNRPAWYLFLSFNSPALAKMSASTAATFVKQTNETFASRPDRLRPETRGYLAKAAGSPN
jgi:hypothetical protein